MDNLETNKDSSAYRLPLLFLNTKYCLSKHAKPETPFKVIHRPQKLLFFNDMKQDMASITKPALFIPMSLA
jgi:hypothetical protein